jgi:hypothetical protein
MQMFSKLPFLSFSIYAAIPGLTSIAVQVQNTATMARARTMRGVRRCVTVQWREGQLTINWNIWLEPNQEGRDALIT